MATYALVRFTSPNAGVLVNQAATDQYIAAAYGQALKNLDVNALGLAIANAATAAFTLVLPSGASMTFQAGSTLTLSGVLTAALTAASTLDMSLASDTAGLKLPSKAGAAPIADGFLAFDTTAHELVYGSNGSTIVVPLMTKLTASLGSDQPLNNTGTYFDGPSVAQGTSGTWLVIGSVALTDTASSVAAFKAKLWDGTTVIDSRVTQIFAASGWTSVTLMGTITSPAANLKISVEGITATTGKILFNASGNSKDSSIIAVRIG